MVEIVVQMNNGKDKDCLIDVAGETGLCMGINNVKPLPYTG